MFFYCIPGNLFKTQRVAICVAKITSIIDIFAGPGGLGEGFSAYKNKSGLSPFKIRASIEKEFLAHQTLTLRAFFRQFKQPPKQYYDFVHGVISLEELYEQFPSEHKAACEETLHGPRVLGPDGSDDKIIYKHLKTLKKEITDEWVVIGGPPCQAYSLAGRARNKNNNDYDPAKDIRHFLYKEYLKVLTEVRPAVFVMENVKGILSSKIKEQPIFPRILNDLRCPDAAFEKTTNSNFSKYKIYSLVTGSEVYDSNATPEQLVIRSEQYGIPQTRHRVILIGVREDIKKAPKPLIKYESEVKFGECIKDLPRLRSGITTIKGVKTIDSPENWFDIVNSNESLIKRELISLGLKTNKLASSLNAAKKLKRRGGQFVSNKKEYEGPAHLKKWTIDKKLEGTLNHETKGHMALDLARYMYCALYAQQNSGNSPRSNDFPKSLAPNHKNWKSGKFADRFRVQDKNSPAKTITSHIAKDGHAFIHPDPGQCRSLTVREAARAQTFPDNYFFLGQRTAQSVQVGNAVPPFLANQIAEIIDELLT